MVKLKAMLGLDTSIRWVINTLIMKQLSNMKLSYKSFAQVLELIQFVYKSSESP